MTHYAVVNHRCMEAVDRVLVEFSPTTRDIMVTVLSCSLVPLKGADITQCQDYCVFQMEWLGSQVAKNVLDT